MIRKTPEAMKYWLGIYPSVSFLDNTCHCIAGMGNTGVFDTKEGLVIFDTPYQQYAGRIFREIRSKTSKPVKFIIFSHGHFDHAFGFAPFLREVQEKGWEKPEVIAHENIIKRFNKYKMLEKYHDWINKMQFASVVGKKKPRVVNPQKNLNPTIIIRGNEGSYSFSLGNLSFEIYHDKGESDDSIWLWVPEKQTICAGDLFVSSFPNVGNPYKVQRYPKDWAIAMEKMMEKEPEYLIPGHGPLIKGKREVNNALSITAEVMHFVHDEVVKKLNEGKWFEQIYHEMLEIFPEKFKTHKMLRPVYGCYEFAIHATYRLYHGWYDTGNPTDLFPAKTTEIAKELLKINGENSYLNHTKDLFKQGKQQLALHMVDIIILGRESVKKETYLEALILKKEILKEKVKEEPSFIAANILNNYIRSLRKDINELKENFNI